jgi:transposase-like protein
MSETKTFRTFSTEFKLAAIERMEAGSVVTALARELNVKRKLLYQWHSRWKAEGEAGLNRKRGPKPGRRRPKPKPEPAPPGSPAELAQARARIAQLERIIGRQQIDIDFFRKALLALDEGARQGKERISSTPSSKP